MIIGLWVERFPRIGLQPKWNEANEKDLGKGWTRRIERFLMKCSLVHDCIIQRVAMLADLY